MVWRKECLRIFETSGLGFSKQALLLRTDFKVSVNKLIQADMQPIETKRVTRGLKVGLIIANGPHGSPPRMRPTSRCSLCKPSECDDPDEQAKMSIAPITPH